MFWHIRNDPVRNYEPYFIKDGSNDGQKIIHTKFSWESDENNGVNVEKHIPRYYSTLNTGK